jgi:hypothetical protein
MGRRVLAGYVYFYFVRFVAVFPYPFGYDPLQVSEKSLTLNPSIVVLMG